LRFIALDVHRDFCEVAISEDGRIRGHPRIPADVEHLQVFAQSLAPDDHVCLEVTGNALAIVRILEPFVERVVLVNAKAVRAITSAKVKTDKIDARTLVKLLAAGFLPEVWAGDEPTRVLRRRISRRAQLVKQRTQTKNEIHAVLQRNLKGRPPATDLFGRKGRRWLSQLELTMDERQTVDACLRQIDFLNAELELVERGIAVHALDCDDIRRLMTIPGISVTTAATFMAVIGDIGRFPTPRHLVGYLGLDPKVRQSGSAPARHGRISKQGSSEARHVLVEAAWTATRAPGPLKAFAERVRARRGANIATVAVARKLAVLCWHLLVRGEDYAFTRPSLNREKVRRLELLAGAEQRRGRPHKVPIYVGPEQHRREQELAAQAEIAYRRLMKDWAPRSKKGAGATTGARISKSAEATTARQGSAPSPAL
jgi:transposase